MALQLSTVVQPFIKSHQILFPLTIECIWGFTD